MDALAAPSRPWQLRVPGAAERVACWMLLPDVDRGVQDLQLLIAVDDAGAVIGAAALGCQLAPGGRERWHVDLHVVPPHRGRGVARAMLARLVAMARAHGIDAVHGWGWYDEASDAARALAAMGFAPCEHRYEFLGPMSGVLESCGPLCEAARRRGRVPADARVVPLTEADPLAIARLHAEHLGGSVESLLPLLAPGRPGGFDAGLSGVLFVGDELAGCILCRLYPARQMYSCDAVIIAPGFRRGWANALLRYELALRARAAGYESIRFHAMTRHRDTQHVSRRHGSGLSETSVRMRLPIGPTDGTPAAPDGRDA